MLRLSKKTDYALLALHYLASEAPAGVASARAISDRFDIPLELLAKVLQHLARQGFVIANKGVHGGYHLAQAASAISVAQVVQAIDGPLAGSRDPLSSVKARILAVLETVSLADMAAGEGARSVPVTVSNGGPASRLAVQAR